MPISRGLIINGAETPSSDARTTTDHNPWDGSVYATVAAGTTEDVRRAVDAAFAHWSRTKPAVRRRIFLKAAELVAGRADEIARIMAEEVGAAAGWAAFNAQFAADLLLEAAAAVTQPAGQGLATDGRTLAERRRIPPEGQARDPRQPS